VRDPRKGDGGHVRRWVLGTKAELLVLLFRKEKRHLDTLDPPDCLRPS
jgi:hypothetical protein